MNISKQVMIYIQARKTVPDYAVLAGVLYTTIHFENVHAKPCKSACTNKLII